MSVRFGTVGDAVAEVAAGRPVVVVDDADREDEGDLILAAEHATAEGMGFLVRHTSGLVCVALPGADCDRLGLPPMVAANADRHRTAFTVTVDAAAGVGTGISAADRARTARLLADAGTGPDDLARPGHVLPLRARDGGVLARPGHTEAAVDLARLAGLRPAGVLCELVDDSGRLLRRPALAVFAAEHGLASVTVADLAAHLRRAARRPVPSSGPVPSSVPVPMPAPVTVPAAPRPAAAPRVSREAETVLPTRHGRFRAVGYLDRDTGREHMALVAGDPAGGADVLVRVHSECLTGDVFGSLRCDCGEQLDTALAAVAAAGCGVVVYLRGHEGRGIGLLAKLQAYRLQEAGADTVQANLALGLPADAREYAAAAAILADLGVRSARLLTNNPAKESGLAGAGLAVTRRVRMAVRATPENVRYLATKRDRFGHDVPPLPTLPPSGAAGAVR